MNALPLLVAVPLLLAAPLAWIATPDAVEAPAGAPASDAPAAPAAQAATTAGFYRLRVNHSGSDAHVDLAVSDLEGHGIHAERVVLRASREVVVELTLPPGAYRATLAGRSFAGSTVADLRECDSLAAETLMETSAGPSMPILGGGGSIVVRAQECVEPPAADGERHAGRAVIEHSVATPASSASRWNGGLSFPVREGATSVEVRARWAPSTPASERLRIELLAYDGCGACWTAVAGEDGAGEVVFTHAFPAAGEHQARASAAPTGVAVGQAVYFDVTVRYG